MKILKFESGLAKLILNGTKTTTWRLFDEKNLKVGDEISLVVSGTNKEFAKAKITEVFEVPMGEIKQEHIEGHEKYASESEMFKTFSNYYKKKVDKNTSLKVIKFVLLG